MQCAWWCGACRAVVGDGGLTSAGERPQQGLGDKRGERHPNGPLWF